MSYTDEDLDQLDALLQALTQEQFPMTVSELNGYLTGILVAPDLVMPSEWLPGVWNEDGTNGFPGLASAEATIQAVMGHYNDTAALINDVGWIEPFYEEDIHSGETLYEPWIDGFARAMQLREPEWLAIANGPDSDAKMAVNMIFMMQEIYEGNLLFVRRRDRQHRCGCAGSHPRSRCDDHCRDPRHRRVHRGRDG